jgi:transposase InsO family protein
MPWKESSVLSERIEFIKQAQQADVNFSQLCKTFGVSRKTGYKWLNRFQEEGVIGLADRSRRPIHMPAKTSSEIEKAVLEIRKTHPTWGGRKIYARLKKLEHEYVPCPSTITAILHRNECIDPKESRKRKAFQFFEMEQPNQLWQMDFKGHFYVSGKKCHPLTILDDHSRYLIGLRACKNQQKEIVKAHLTDIFREYGLPDTFLVDNGPPWGPSDGQPFYTRLNAWMFRLDIKVIRSRPYHPQTLGKDERLHRTLKSDVIKRQTFDDFRTCQTGFDTWQQIYNHERPHEALDMEVPASRYSPSQREFPETLPPITYLPDDQVRKVHDGGRIHFLGRTFRVGRAFDDYPVAVRATVTDGEFDVYFCRQKIKTISFLE